MSRTDWVAVGTALSGVAAIALAAHWLGGGGPAGVDPAAGAAVTLGIAGGLALLGGGLVLVDTAAGLEFDHVQRRLFVAGAIVPLAGAVALLARSAGVAGAVPGGVAGPLAAIGLLLQTAAVAWGVLRLVAVAARENERRRRGE